MRIAMIGQKGIPAAFGGIERHVEALAVRLGRAGHDVRVYTRTWYAPADRRYAPGVTAVATPTIRTKHLDAIIHTFTSTLHAVFAGTDIFHFHGVGPALLAWLPRLLAPQSRVVVTFHCVDATHAKWGRFARLMLTLGERAACRFPHVTIAVSKTLCRYIRETYGSEALYLPNGVEEPPMQKQDLTKKFNLQKGGYVAMVSRLVRHKGAHHLIAAWKHLRARGLTAGKKLVIVGDSAFTDGYVKELRRAAAGQSDILFTGYLKGKALHQMFANAYCIAHPSESEGLPIAVLEAMSFGKCVVASDIPENLEALGECGVKFKNGNARDLARSLEFVLRRPTLARAKGAESRRHVLAHYRWDEIAKGVNWVYGGLFSTVRVAKKIA